MAATFIKKDDGNFYLRLTGSTNYIKFGAVSESGNTYTFYVNGTAYVSKPYNENGVIYYTSSATPIPAGGNLDNSRFPGTETIFTFSGSGIRDYILSFSAGPTSGTSFYLGGASLTWGGYAYPGDGYLNEAIAVGVKQGGIWKNSGNLFVKKNGEWKEVQRAYIKVDGIWKKFFENYGNSSWINMLEAADDAIDFGVQVKEQNVFTSLDPNTSNFTRSLSVYTANGDASWSSFMKTYASWPYPGQINTGITYSSTWTINVTVPGNYILEAQADNIGTITFDGTLVANLYSFTTSTIVPLNNLTIGTHTVYATILNMDNNDPNRSDWTWNPAGIAWRIAGPN